MYPPLVPQLWKQVPNCSMCTKPPGRNAVSTKKYYFVRNVLLEDGPFVKSLKKLEIHAFLLYVHFHMFSRPMHRFKMNRCIDLEKIWKCTYTKKTCILSFFNDFTKGASSRCTFLTKRHLFVLRAFRQGGFVHLKQCGTCYQSWGTRGAWPNSILLKYIEILKYFNIFENIEYIEILNYFNIISIFWKYWNIELIQYFTKILKYWNILK